MPNQPEISLHPAEIHVLFLPKTFTRMSVAALFLILKLEAISMLTNNKIDRLVMAYSYNITSQQKRTTDSCNIHKLHRHTEGKKSHTQKNTGDCIYMKFKLIRQNQK